MTTTQIGRAAAVSGLTLAALAAAFALPRLRAQGPAIAPALGGAATAYAGGMMRAPEPDVDTPRVHVAEPVTGPAARVWAALAEPVDMPFAAEVPLEEALAHIRKATQSEALPKGIPFYVDPAALQEAEQTMQSPVTLALEGIPLRTTLGLLLGQLDLTYRVHPDGFVTVAYIGSRSLDEPDAHLRILDELRALRAEVAALRSGGGGMRGGMGGTGGSMTAPPPAPAVPGSP